MFSPGRGVRMHVPPPERSFAPTGLPRLTPAPPRGSRRGLLSFAPAGLLGREVLMAVVAGVDYGTLSVRVSVVDSERGRLGSGVADYPLNRRRADPDYATQSHAEHMRALVEAMGKALASAKASGETIEAIAVDTTGSSVIPVDENLEPIDDYYLWCDHRAWREAALITETAHRTGLPAIQWCGGV